MRGLNQYAQTLSSPFLLLFVLVSEALQAAACQKSENRLVRGWCGVCLLEAFALCDCDTPKAPDKIAIL